MSTDPELLRWLLDSDPALRWQVERDLASAAPEIWQATRARVAKEGFGARLLTLQDADGQWAGGAFFPRGFADSPERREPGQPYTATTWSLNALREWGVEAAALDGTVEKLAAHSRWEYDDLPYWGGEVDVCINAYTLANGAWLGADVSALEAWFPAHRQPDGGWNCQSEEGSGSIRSSFHSTLNALGGILDHEIRTGGTDDLRAARRTGEEYLLTRRLTRRLSDGLRVGPWVDFFGYPFRWSHTSLKAVDYFRAAALHAGTPPDERIADAIEIVRAARQADGTWLQGHRFPGRVWFETDVQVGEPSKWLTFYGTRVLNWWDER